MYKNLAFGVGLDSLDVLLVEGNRGMQKILSAMLAANRVHRVRFAASATAALDDMLVATPGVLVTDWTLPDSDPETLIRTMRTPALHPLCFVPVIVLAAQVSRTLVQDALRAGASTVLKKPVSANNLVARLEWVSNDARTFELDGDRYALPLPEAHFPTAAGALDTIAL
jgi:DNA-binding response OmpR family regulator